MADVSSTVIVAAVAAPAAAGRPPEEVILWAFLGALAAVYLERGQSDSFNIRWVVSALGMMFASVLSGIVGSALVLQAAPSWTLTAPLAKIERWILACIIAALIHKAGPLLWGMFKARAKNVEGANDVRP